MYEHAPLMEVASANIASIDSNYGCYLETLPESRLRDERQRA